MSGRIVRSRLRLKMAAILSICLTFAIGQLRGSEPLITAAVDAKGVWHQASEYHGRTPPWISDLAESIGPEYSPRDRLSRNQGSGLFRLKLDLRTGTVTNIAVIKAIGITTLDQSALAALRQWRWKPGKWKEVDIPITFGMSSGPPILPPGAVYLPHP
jgi:TonB family protein